MSKTISGRQAAIDVLREMGGRGPVKDVCAEAAKRAKLGGPTPNATVASMMYQRAKKGQTFRIVERGVVELIEAQEPTQEQDETSPAVTPGTVVLKDPQAEAKPDPKPKSQKKSRSRKPKAAATA